MHHTSDQQSVGDPEFLGHGEEPGALVVLNILARVEHVKSPDPQRNRRAQNEHAQIEAAGDGDPGGGRRDAQRKSEKKMRPVGEPLGEGIEKQHGDS